MPKHYSDYTEAARELSNSAGSARFILLPRRVEAANKHELLMLRDHMDHMTNKADIERCQLTIASIENGMRRYGTEGMVAE